MTDSTKEEIQNLKARIAALESRCECDVDWSKVKRGTFVEFRDSEDSEWMMGRLSVCVHGSKYPFIGMSTSGHDGSSWKQCRLAPLAPSIMNWQINTGICPDEKLRYFVIYRSGYYSGGLGSSFRWNLSGLGGRDNDIIQYAVFAYPECCK